MNLSHPRKLSFIKKKITTTRARFSAKEQFFRDNHKDNGVKIFFVTEIRG